MKFDAKVARSLEKGYRPPEIVQQRLRTLTALSLNAGEHALDVGCGPGFLVADMALQVGPEGRAVGLDSSPDMLELAAARTAEFAQVELSEGNLQEVPAPDAAFDAVACTQVLLFVEDVPSALGEMHRVLKPGGRIAVLETDWRGVVMATDDDGLTRRLFDFWDRKAVSPNLPVRLLPMLRDAGFIAASVEAVPIINTGFTRGNFSNGFIRGLAKQARQADVIDEATQSAWLTEMQRRDARGDYFFSINRYLFSAVKP